MSNALSITQSLTDLGITPENIKEGQTIFGVNGTADISPVTITNGLSTTLEIHTYNSPSGFVKTEIQAGATETHNLYDGVLVLNLPVDAKVTTVGAKTDLTNTSLSAGAYCIGFAGVLSLSISA